ncbi:MAG TPA: type II toxin-antitoxin system death-on-curing family toxin [Phototrophicaceae bacterium]|nr:type II toxin-antitoxin system death-on-curing family toxin [Phototrophicaceae bacterium]
MRYITVSELLYINGTLLNKPEILSGWQQIRDLQLLDAAAARPMTSAFGADAYPTLREKAAALLHSLTRNHPFTDGNKRTATVGIVMMFRVNGQTVTWAQDDALDMILRVAEGRASLEQAAAWFPLKDCPYDLPPDSETDMRLIAQIISEQKGLLDELERR